MEVDSTPTPPSTKSAGADEAEVDTPPFSIKPLSFTNGVLKRRPPTPVAYRECMKNHAAAIGGHAVDGCGEFMPSPSSSSSLTCAACGCHRNFHRRDPESPTSAAAITPPFLDFRHPTLPKRFSLSPSPPGRGVLGIPAAEEHHPAPVTPTVEINPVGRKRFRTKFSQNQKEKMLRFAVELGWKMQKSDDAAVKEFCHGIGVPKGVLKVWMHNNKNNYTRKETSSGGGSGGGAGIANDSVISYENSGGSGSGSGGSGGGEERKAGSNVNLFEMSENGSGGAHFHGCSSS